MQRLLHAFLVYFDVCLQILLPLLAKTSFLSSCASLTLLKPELNSGENFKLNMSRGCTRLNWFRGLRGCSYGGELAQLGGLARLSEISPSLRNSYKNIMCSYEKWASPPRWDLTWFCRDLTKVRWKFSI